MFEGAFPWYNKSSPRDKTKARGKQEATFTTFSAAPDVWDLKVPDDEPTSLLTPTPHWPDTDHLPYCSSHKPTTGRGRSNSKYSFCFFSLHLKAHFPTTVKGRWVGREWGTGGCSPRLPPSILACSQSTSGTVYHPAADSDRKGNGWREIRVPVSGLLQRDYHVTTFHYKLDFLNVLFLSVISQCKFWGGKISLK